MKTMGKKIIRTKDGFRVTHINRRRACRFMGIECSGWIESEANKCIGKMMDETICALVPFKTIAGKQNAKIRDEAIRKFCLECMCGNSQTVGSCKSYFCPLHPYRKTLTDKTSLFENNIPDEIILQKKYKVLYDEI